MHEREGSEHLVGRPGLDPGTLRVAPNSPVTSFGVQICWPEGVRIPPSSTEMQDRLLSWLDNWLDLDQFQGDVEIEIQHTST